MNTQADERTRARRELTVFLLLTFAISWSILGHLIWLGGSIEKEHGLEVFALMWVPGLVSLACRAYFRLGVRDVSFSRGKSTATWLVAWLAPVAVGALAYGLAWSTGIAPLHAPFPNALENVLHLAHAPWLFRVASWSVVMLVLGTLLGSISAAGEEIGWRGFMTTRLVASGLPHPLLLGGLIWGVWHVPLILSGQYASGPYPLLSALLFVVNVVAAGYLAGVVRLRSGSVWPAVVFHASWNAQIQAVFDRFAHVDKQSGSALWLGESGLLVVLANVLVTVLLLRWLSRRQPPVTHEASAPEALAA